MIGTTLNLRNLNKNDNNNNNNIVIHWELYKRGKFVPVYTYMSLP